MSPLPTYLLLLLLLIALLHLYFLWLEMFAWTRRGPRVFRGFPRDLFKPTRAMAANQGLYNGFLAAGLLWSLWIQDPLWSRNVALFFSCCVTVAGIYGAYSVSRTIFWVQGLPALISIGLLLRLYL
jgi:putative membrane protein